MRKLILQHTDHDVVDGSDWTFDQDAILLTPTILLSRHHDAFILYLFEEAADETQLVKASDSRMITLHVSGALIDDLSHEDLAKMSIVELSQALARAPKE